jgi:prolyl 4-hydroxylase
MYAAHIDLEKPLFWIVDDALTDEACSRLIQRAEKIGFDEATVNLIGGDTMRKDLRNNDRIIMDDEELAASIFNRVKDKIPPEMMAMDCVGLNERFRVYRYTQGMRFTPHYDGAFVRNTEECSCVSVLFYLNGDCEGGDTNLLDLKETVSPKTGRALFFQHRLLHEGAEVHAGIKYVLRTDVMYRTKKPKQDTPTP